MKGNISPELQEILDNSKAQEQFLELLRSGQDGSVKVDEKTYEITTGAAEAIITKSNDASPGNAD